MKQLVEQLKRHEGYRQFPYKDTVGKLTVGIGLNLDDRGLTEWEAEFILRDQLLNIEGRLNMFSWFNIQDRVRKDAIINMAFNLGIGGLLNFEKMIMALQNKDYDEAYSEALDSKWATQVGNRANELATQIKTGKRQ